MAPNLLISAILAKYQENNPQLPLRTHPRAFDTSRMESEASSVNSMAAHVPTAATTDAAASTTDDGPHSSDIAGPLMPKLETMDSSSAIPTIHDTLNAQPAPLSDNPLDAPEAPRPDEEDDDGQEDGEMGGMDEPPKQENGSPEKAGVDGQTSQQVDGGTGNQTLEGTAIPALSARPHLVTQTHAIVLPSYSTWFDMHKIHQLEDKAMPEFFNSRNRSKTPSVYKDYRDFMINTYRLNPTEYLTVTACRRNLAGDVCAIMRVHAFCEQWGLINYQVDADKKPSVIGPPFTGHFRIIADTPRGLQPFQPTTKIESTSGLPFGPTERALAATPLKKSELMMEGRRNVFDRSGKDVTTVSEAQANGEGSSINGVPDAEAATKTVERLAKELTKPVYCRTCGVDCTRVRWHCAKTSGASGSTPLLYDYCASCFSHSKIDSDTKSVDYVKLEDPDYSTIQDGDTPWTDSELMRLLEAIELFDENWNSISDHVGSRTREECVMKFLQLEIEDDYLEDGSEAHSYVALNTGHLPYSQSVNPVMSVVSFLAGMNPPAVAAVAAGRSVAELKSGLEKERETLRLGREFTSRQGESATKPTEEIKNEDSMDIDNAESPQADNRNEAALPHGKREPSASLATVALASSAARAAVLASHEERQMTNLVAAAVNISLEKFELKLAQFSEMESVLQAERQELEKGRQQLFLDRLAFKKKVREVQGALRKMKIEDSRLGMFDEQKLGFLNVTGRAEDDVRPLGMGDEGFRGVEM
ncbi:hypothetical protein MMC17_010040 [Xylographa soralifera]|nr:hypothetical protein [Xylographa soralifera]